MNNLFSAKKLLVVVASCMLSTGALWADVNPKPFVVPELKTWTGAEGQTALSGRIVLKNAKLKAVAEALANDYKTMFGKELTIVSGTAKGGDIVLSLKKDKTLGDEGYSMNIGSAVELSAATEHGLFWATRTLLQVSEQHKDGQLPKGKTVDVPEYKLRGFMIDCGRKYIPMSYLRHLTKIMSYYKMNTLQVHLNDNGFRQYFGNDWLKTQAAFRLECDTYPGLTAKDGSYTKAEFIDLQRLAEQNGVEIIPEIDAPAHSLAFTQYKNELGSKEYGMDHLDLFNPETYTFVDGLLREYLEGDEPVFRGKRVHIGTDEYSNKKKEVVEKFRYFTDYYIRFVEKFGKQACIWGALTHAKGDTPVKSDNVVMGAWYNGYANPADMIKQGYKLISIPDGLLYIVPAAGYYYDYLNTEYLYKNWTPAHIGKEIFPEKHEQILGGMFAVWNDHYGNGISTKDIHDRVMPAMQTLAVKMWNGTKTSVPYANFDSLRTNISEAPGVNVAGRIGTAKSCVFTTPKLVPGSETGYTEIGYNYKVEFTINGVAEDKGTVLLSSPDAVFYLSDPIQGKLGFARDGYLNTFNYSIRTGERTTVAVMGDNKSTRLYINGKLKENLNIQKRWFNAGKDSMNYVRTLVFPLEKAGNFKSTITDMKVFNHLTE